MHCTALHYTALHCIVWCYVQCIVAVTLTSKMSLSSIVLSSRPFMQPAREKIPLFGPFAGPKRRVKQPAVRFTEGESGSSTGLSGRRGIVEGRDRGRGEREGIVLGRGR